MVHGVAAQHDNVSEYSLGRTNMVHCVAVQHGNGDRVPSWQYGDRVSQCTIMVHRHTGGEGRGGQRGGEGMRVRGQRGGVGVILISGREAEYP